MRSIAKGSTFFYCQKVYVVVITCLFLLEPGLAMAVSFRDVNKSLDAKNLQLLELPLFSPQRRKPVEPAPLVVPEIKKPQPVIIQQPVENRVVFPDWDLIGLVQSSEGGMAVVRSQTSAEVFRLGIGDGYDNWRLVSVEAKSATFRNGEVTTVLKFLSADE